MLGRAGFRAAIESLVAEIGGDLGEGEGARRLPPGVEALEEGKEPEAAVVEADFGGGVAQVGVLVGSQKVNFLGGLVLGIHGQKLGEGFGEVGEGVGVEEGALGGEGGGAEELALGVEAS